MDHMKILSRAWTLTWRYRALWLFGFLFVLAGGTGGGGGGNGNWRFGERDFRDGNLPFDLPPIDWNTMVILIVAAILVILALSIIMAIVRYVAATALIAGVDEIESAEAPFTIRRGFQLGWSRQAWRLFLLDLVIGLPLALISITLLALAAAPLLAWATQAPETLKLVATLVSVGAILVVILIIFAIVLIFSLIKPYIQRRAVLDKQGVLASIRQGVALVRASLLDTGLMWLLLAGISIAWGLVMIPIALMLLVAAALIGLLPGGLIYLVTQSWVAGVIVGGLLFLVTLIPAVSFIQGVFEVYTSSAWTLTYREARARHAAVLPLPASA